MELIKGSDQKTSYSAIKKGISEFSLSVKGMDDRIHVLACSALTHASLYGDSTLCTECVQAMPKSARGESLKKWFTKYGALMWVTVGEEQKFRKNDKGKYSLEIAYETPFYVKPEHVPEAFSVEKLLKMLDAVGKRAADGKKKGTLSIDAVAFDRIKASASKIVADLAPPVQHEASNNVVNIIDAALQKTG